VAHELTSSGSGKKKMLKKRVDDKLRELRERLEKLPEMEVKLDKLQRRHAKLQGSMAETATPPSAKGRKRAIEQVDGNEEKKQDAKKKKEIDIIKKELVDPSVESIRKQLSAVDYTFISPEMEAMLVKKRQLTILGEEIRTLSATIDAVRDGKEIQNYWLNSATFIMQYEEEKRVEKVATTAMSKYSQAHANLNMYLQALPPARSGGQKRPNPSGPSYGGDDDDIVVPSLVFAGKLRGDALPFNPCAFAHIYF